MTNWEQNVTSAAPAAIAIDLPTKVRGLTFGGGRRWPIATADGSRLGEPTGKRSREGGGPQSERCAAQWGSPVGQEREKEKKEARLANE